MFYVKDGDKKIDIEDDNVFTECPVCGEEKQVDLQDFHELDLYGINIYCVECAEKAKQARLRVVK